MEKVDDELEANRLQFSSPHPSTMFLLQSICILIHVYYLFYKSHFLNSSCLTWETAEMIFEPPEAPKTSRTSLLLSTTTIGDIEDIGLFPG